MDARQDGTMCGSARSAPRDSRRRGRFWPRALVCACIALFWLLFSESLFRGTRGRLCDRRFCEKAWDLLGGYWGELILSAELLCVALLRPRAGRAKGRDAPRRDGAALLAFCALTFWVVLVPGVVARLWADGSAGVRGGRRGAVWILLLAVLGSGTVGAAALFDQSPFRGAVGQAVELIGRGAGPSKGNTVSIIDSGDDALLLRTHLIRNARRSVRIQTFIWTNDDVGRHLMRDLIKAAKRGVDVRIIADHFVSHKDPDIVAFLATVHPKLRIRHYRPAAGRIRPSKLHVFRELVLKFRSFNQRMHNKVMVFDDVAAITGGRNIENSYFNRSTGMNFKDRDIFVIGPVVPEMRRSFDEYWRYRHSVPSEQLADVAAAIARDDFARYETHEFATGGLCDDVDREADDDRVIRERFVDRLLPVSRAAFLADAAGKNRSLWLHGRGRITKELRALVKGARREIITRVYKAVGGAAVPLL